MISKSVEKLSWWSYFLCSIFFAGPPGVYSGPPSNHSTPFSYGYPPGARGAPYQYHAPGYEGQYPRQSAPYRPSAPPRPGPHSQHGPPPPLQQESSPHKVESSTSPAKSSPNRSPLDVSPSSRAKKSTDLVEVERLRAAAAAELTHEEVKPIQSDFHFFAKENASRFRAMAEEEIRNSLKTSDKLDPFLVNSNMNSRLKIAWEKLSDEERDAFMIKEEDDRRRFMEEDEIASRHCATLTARGKSPRTPEKTMKGDTQSSERERRQGRPRR